MNKSHNTCNGVQCLGMVDAAIELSNQFDTPLMLIASRRQIDQNFWWQLLNNWFMQFSDCVIKRDKKKNFINKIWRSLANELEKEKIIY